MSDELVITESDEDVLDAFMLETQHLAPSANDERAAQMQLLSSLRRALELIDQMDT